MKPQESRAEVPSEFSIDRSLLSDGRSFLNGAEYSLVQQPYDGVRQLLSHSGIPMGDINFAHEPSDTDGYGSAGSMVGSVFKFWLVNQAMGGITGLGKLGATSTWMGEALKMGLSGAAVEAASPIKEDGHFGREKAASIATGFGAFAVFGAINGKANEIGFLGREGFRSFPRDSIVYGVSGALSGATGAELHAVLSDGRPATLSELSRSAGENAALGFGLAAIAHVMPGQIKLEPATDGARTSDLSTEEWVSKHYDSTTEIRSPILTWLADNKPKLRPVGFATLREAAWREHGAVDLSLGDWAPAERPAVISALRKLSQKDLGSDANIDAFISRFARPEMQQLSQQYGKSVEPIAQVKAEIEQEIANHPQLADKSIGDLQYDPATRQMLRSPENEFLLAKVGQLNALQRESFLGTERKPLEDALEGEFNVLNQEIGLPPLKIGVFAEDGAISTSGRIDLGLGQSPSMSANSIENAYHEFTHHAQGPFYGAQSIQYMAKYPWYRISRSVGWRDSIPPMQETSNREQFLTNYVGSTIEKQAYATGLLARIRVMAADVPKLD